MHLRDRRRIHLVAAVAAALAAPACGAATRGGKKRAVPIAADEAPDLVTYGAREDVMQFAAEIAERSALDLAWVRAALRQAKLVPSVQRFIMPPPSGTAKNWAAYRGRFVEPVRIGAGLAFWRANEIWLRRAEERWGVPPEVVVGIVGVETIYGRQMGSFRVLDTLSTLSFDFPPGRKDRSAFFRDELEALFVLCRDRHLDPWMPTGSFAGAMGMPQFMPSSVNRHAVDFDGDGRIDLRSNPADVIGSVANYLAAFGWQRDLPIRFDVAAPVDAADRAFLLGPDILPSFSTEDFAERGARLGAEALAADRARAASGGLGKLALVELQNGGAAPTYVAGTTNFYAITRYNASSYYAMAVIELGEAVKAAATAGTRIEG